MPQLLPKGTWCFEKAHLVHFPTLFPLSSDLQAALVDSLTVMHMLTGISTHSPPLFLYLSLAPHHHLSADLSDDVIFLITTRLLFGWARSDPQRRRGFHMGLAVTFFLSTYIWRVHRGSTTHTSTTVDPKYYIPHNHTNIYTYQENTLKKKIFFFVLH